MKLELAVAVAVMAIASLSVAAGAADPRNTPTGADLVRPKPSADQPLNVRGTGGGMPPTAQVMFANVNADGTLESSFPAAVTSLRLGVGTYDVRFTGRDIAECAATITYGSPTSFGAATGLAPTAVQRAGSGATGYFIQTFNTTTTADKEFMLHVTC